jgi:F0F1-type ATP synthase assembly protein I
MAEDPPARRGARPPSEATTERRPSGADVGWGITGTMLSGIIVWGGVGLALDRWLGTKFFALIGVILGLSVAIYIVIMKYAPPVPPVGRTGRATASGGRRSRPRTQKGQR